MTALKDMRRGRLDFRVDRDAIVHAALGKVSLRGEVCTASPLQAPPGHSCPLRVGIRFALSAGP